MAPLSSMESQVSASTMPQTSSRRSNLVFCAASSASSTRCSVAVMIPTASSELGSTSSMSFLAADSAACVSRSTASMANFRLTSTRRDSVSDSSALVVSRLGRLVARSVAILARELRMVLPTSPVSQMVLRPSAPAMLRRSESAARSFSSDIISVACRSAKARMPFSVLQPLASAPVAVTMERLICMSSTSRCFLRSASRELICSASAPS